MKKPDAITVTFLLIVIIGIVAIVIQNIFFYHLITTSLDTWQGILIQFLQIISVPGILIVFIKLFKKIIKQRIKNGFFNVTQVKINYISNDLNAYIQQRMNMLAQIGCDHYPQSAMLATLDLLLSFLKGYNAAAIYEISIFTDTETPRIICFKDSSGHLEARSSGKQKDEPDYYIKHGYEVIKYLQNPCYSVEIKQFNHNDNYQRATDIQRKRIRTEIFHCFDVEQPHVLVVTCDKKKVFKENDEDLKQVIRTIGLLLKSELILKNNFCCPHDRHCVE